MRNAFHVGCVFVLSVLALSGCAMGLDIGQFCPFRIDTPQGSYFVQCDVTAVDASADAAGDAAWDAGAERLQEAAQPVQEGGDVAEERGPRDTGLDVESGARDVVGDRADAGRDVAAVSDVREADAPVPPGDAQALNAAVIRGVNDIGFWRGGTDRLQLRQSMAAAGARYVRIPFADSAADNGGIDTPAWRLSVVDGFLAQGITPIPVAFFSRSGREATCGTDPAIIGAVVDDWIGGDAPMLKSRNVVLNVANEWGPGDPGVGTNDPGLAVWRDTYVTAIQRIRGAGIQVPLLIDAPGCGQNALAVERFGTAVAAADPLGKVMFSVHVYPSFWTTGVAESWQFNLATHFNALQATGLRIVIGEFSSSEFGTTVGPGVLAPGDVIAAAQARAFGWLSWEWYNDSAESIVSGPGNVPRAYPPAANLTPFGVTVVTALLGRAP